MRRVIALLLLTGCNAAIDDVERLLPRCDPATDRVGDYACHIASSNETCSPSYDATIRLGGMEPDVLDQPQAVRDSRTWTDGYCRSVLSEHTPTFTMSGYTLESDGGATLDGQITAKGPTCSVSFIVTCQRES